MKCKRSSDGRAHDHHTLQVSGQTAQAVFALEDKVKTLASDTRHDASGMATKRDIAGVKEEIVAVKDELTDVRSDVRVLTNFPKTKVTLGYTGIPAAGRMI